MRKLVRGGTKMTYNDKNYVFKDNIKEIIAKNVRKYRIWNFISHFSCFRNWYESFFWRSGGVSMLVKIIKFNIILTIILSILSIVFAIIFNIKKECKCQ